MSKLDENTVLWLKKWAGTLTEEENIKFSMLRESEGIDFIQSKEKNSEIESENINLNNLKIADQGKTGIVGHVNLISQGHTLRSEFHFNKHPEKDRNGSRYITFYLHILVDIEGEFYITEDNQITDLNMSVYSLPDSNIVKDVNHLKQIAKRVIELLSKMVEV